MSSSDKSKPKVYFMTGRFQPFTLGHLKLFNEMLKRASTKSADAPAYLFVSYKKPTFTVKNVVEMREEVGNDSPDLAALKRYAKTEKSILDNPLTTEARLAFIKSLLKKVYPDMEDTEVRSGVFESTVSTYLDVEKMFAEEDYKTGDFYGSMVELSRPVKLFLVNSRITDTGGLKPYFYLKRNYGSHYSVKMVTGSDRDTPAFFSNQNNPINRVETNSRANNVNPSNLSGSKIRMLCMLHANHVHSRMAMNNLVAMYYNLLSKSEIESVLIEPINQSIDEYYSKKSSKPKSSAKPKSVKRPVNRRSNLNKNSASTRRTSRKVEINNSANMSGTQSRRSARSKKSVTYSAMNSESNNNTVRAGKKQKKTKRRLKTKSN